jgi:chemotaxis protein CheD
MTDRIYLRPGEIIVTSESIIVTTVLGSCIAVTFYAQSTGFSGMCHAMLPCANHATDNAFRYVDRALHYMITAFRQKGIKDHEIEVKLLGGGDVLDRISATTASVGHQNITAALEFLDNEGLNLAASDVGGRMGRKIHFHTHTGKVLLSRVKRLTNASIAGAYA